MAAKPTTFTWCTWRLWVSASAQHSHALFWADDDVNMGDQVRISASKALSTYFDRRLGWQNAGVSSCVQRCAMNVFGLSWCSDILIDYIQLSIQASRQLWWKWKLEMRAHSWAVMHLVGELVTPGTRTWIHPESIISSLQHLNIILNIFRSSPKTWTSWQFS